MFRKFRLVLVKSANSKEGLDEKTPEQPKSEKPKSKNKFLGLFHSSSDPELESKPKARKSFLRRKKHHEKENKELQDEAASQILNNHTEKLPDNLLPDELLPDGSLPGGLLVDGPFPDEPLSNDAIPNDMLTEHKLVDNWLSENASQKHSNLDESLPPDALKSMSVSTLNSTPRFDAIDIDPLPPNDEAWARAKEVWEKNEKEETRENEKVKRRKERKGHREKRRDREEKDGKTRTRSKSREKDKEHVGKERSDSKTRSKEKKRREKHENEEMKYEEKKNKEERHRKHKSKSEKHGHKRETSREKLERYGYGSDSGHDSKHERKTDRKHRHKHDHRHESDPDPDHAHEKERKHHEHHKHKDDRHVKNHEEEHHKHSKHREPKPEHKHTKEHDNKYSPYADNKRIELDKVWREYETGKRYHSQEKDMKKIIDRLDGVERFRREERQRMSDRSHDRSSDTSYEVTHRSRSRERRRRSRSREKHKRESDQDSNHSSTWQYSLRRIEARQEKCTADIDTARRSIEHRIKQLEMRFEKQYSSSEKLPDKSPEKNTTGQPRDFKKIVDQVADECREVTRTLEVRTEEMKSEIASVVREQLTHLDEKLNKPDANPSSPVPFFGVHVVGNFRCEETTIKNPGKCSRDDDGSKITASVTSVEPISSADESMVTVIEENSRTTRNSPKECAQTESLSPSSSRESQVRVSQSGALDTLNEPIGQKTSVSSTCDSGISADHPSSPLHLGSQGIENLHEPSLESFEDEPHGDDDSHEQNWNIDGDGTHESIQMMYRRKIKETEERFQERALAEKEILYQRINELESMLLAAREGKGQYT